MSLSSLIKLLPAAMIVALVLSLSSCGDGDESGTTFSADRPWTKQQYIKAASGLCLRHRTRIAQDLQRAMPNEPITPSMAKRGMENVMLAGFRVEYDALRQLPRPPGDEDFLNLMLSKFKTSLAHGETELSLFFRIKPSAYSEFAEGTLMTQEWGIRGCGSLGRTPSAVVRSYQKL